MAKVKVIIAFDRDPAKIGKTIELDEEQAQIQISEGRVRLTDQPAADKPASRRKPEPAAAPVADTAD